MPVRVSERLKNLEPYVPGRSREEVARRYGFDPDEIVKLGSNENPLGPSPKAVEAAKRELERIHEYPEPVAPDDLFDAVLEYLKDPPYPAGEPVDAERENVLIGGDGADEIIDLLTRAYVDPGDPVVIPVPTFTQYEICAKACGAEVRRGRFDPDRDFELDEDSVFEVLDGARIVYLCTPNNPTGTTIEERVIRDVAEELRDGVLLLDHAYVEFASEDLTQLALEYDNVLVLRTCSKALGLAGARVGYCVTDASIVRDLLRIKPVFNLTRPSAAAAAAALRDRDYVCETVELVMESREFLEDELSKREGVKVFPSEANYVFVDVSGTGMDSPTFTEEMLKRGVIIRDCSNFVGIEPVYVRVSTGTLEEDRRFLKALDDVLESG